MKSSDQDSRAVSDSRASRPRTAGSQLAQREGWTNVAECVEKSRIIVTGRYCDLTVSFILDLEFSYDPVEEEYTPAYVLRCRASSESVFFTSQYGSTVCSVVDQWPASDRSEIMRRAVEAVERLAKPSDEWLNDPSTCREGHDKEQS